MSKRSNDRTNLCAFTFVDGRRCRMPRSGHHLYLCTFHARKEARAVAGQKAANDISYHLSGAFLSASDLSLALGRLFTATAQGQMKPKTAATLAYLGNTLLHTLQLARHEYIQSFGTDAWREAVRENHHQSFDYIHPPEPAETASASQAPEPTPATGLSDSGSDAPATPGSTTKTPAASATQTSEAQPVDEEPVEPSESELISK
jgi:hypothetical protein